MVIIFFSHFVTLLYWITSGCVQRSVDKGCGREGKEDRRTAGTSDGTAGGQ